MVKTGSADRPVVLAVDDEPAVLDCLALVLDDTYQVLRARDGTSALEILEKRRVDVVLLDVLMPGADGLAVLERMKAVDPLTEVILVTAVVEVPTIVRAMKLGATDYISKPWNDVHLCRQVDSAVRRRRHQTPPVVLVGEDLGALAALEVLLGRYGILAASVSVSGALATPWPSAPPLVVFDSTGSPGQAAAAVQSLGRRFPGPPLLVLTFDGVGAHNVPPFRRLPPWAVVDKPYALDVLVEHIGRILASHGMPRSSRPRIASSIARAIAFMGAHYREPILVADVAGAVSCSTDQLARDFRESLGLSTKESLVRIRLAIARRLLSEIGAPLEHVAEMCGFGDVSYFSRVFLGHEGSRPGEFRRRRGEPGMAPRRADSLTS